MEKLTRFLVRRKTKEVFIWTELLAKNHEDLEEVVAVSADAALISRTMPDPRHISVVELESMKKADLILFAKLKLDLELDASKKQGELLDEVKVAIFTRPPEDSGPEEVEPIDMRSAKPGQAVNQTTRQPTAARARRSAGA